MEKRISYIGHKPVENKKPELSDTIEQDKRTANQTYDGQNSFDEKSIKKINGQIQPEEEEDIDEDEEDLILGNEEELEEEDFDENDFDVEIDEDFDEDDLVLGEEEDEDDF